VTAPFQVSVAKESLGFSAAHFLAIEGHLCERLHGHNYRLSVTVEGRLDPATGFLIDFAVLKRVLRELVDRMDHRVLIPARNPALAIHEEGDRVRVDYAWPGWLVVPRSHACVLPVAHTTAEVLAEYLAGEVWQSLEREHAGGLSRLELEVEESAGQAARYAVRPGDR
jgi:6-pyruvoyltetrahydropterin/6-carboxytetrahydropterin synthase